ncbi:MAG: MFS transporter [Candidatus Eiseniibacteriota bacterium]
MTESEHGHGTSAPVAMAPLSGRLGWAMFDWANQPFFTVITTFIFAPFFTSVIIADPVRGQSMWGYTQSASGVIIAILSPILGAMADAGGAKKPWILSFQALTVIGCVALWWAVPGGQHTVPLVLAAVIIATIGAEFSIVFNNALLPTLVPPERMGRLSGFGWGMGYVGGLIALFAVLIVSRPELIGIQTPPGEVLFGLDRASHALERLTGPASALWLVAFVIPMFAFTPDTARTGLKALAAARVGVRHLLETLRRLRHYRNQLLYLLAFMIYNDGLAAVIAFGGVYAAGTFGWSTTELGIFGICLTVFATGGCFAGGWLDDRIGSKRTIQIAIVGTIVAALGIMSIGHADIFFGVPVAPRAPGGGLFSSAGEKTFMGFALLLGICMGPMQAASRTLIGRLAPPGMVTEFYGLFALSGRATTFMAPFLIGVFTQVSGSQRAALVVVLVFLVVGFALLWNVKAEQPRR